MNSVFLWQHAWAHKNLTKINILHVLWGGKAALPRSLLGTSYTRSWVRAFTCARCRHSVHLGQPRGLLCTSRRAPLAAGGWQRAGTLPRAPGSTWRAPGGRPVEGQRLALLGGSGSGEKREEEKSRGEGLRSKREESEPECRGGAVRSEAAGSAQSGRELPAGAGGRRGQAREPPTAAGRRPPEGQGLGRAPLGPYGAAAGPGCCSPPSEGARGAARGSAARRHSAGMRNLPILLLLSLSWNLRRVSRRALRRSGAGAGERLVRGSAGAADGAEGAALPRRDRGVSRALL